MTDPALVFDVLWALARRRLHKRIDMLAAAALHEVKGGSYTRSLAQLRRHRQEGSK